MGDRNQLHFLKARIGGAESVLEVGSFDDGITSSFRGFYTGKYVGVDIKAGKGVDVVADLSKTVPDGDFDLVICCSVLEHTPDPWGMARNLTKALRPGGALYVSVPWVWRYHAYPDDYWRFSWRGIETLFPEIRWTERLYSTTRDNDFIPAESGEDDKLALGIEKRKFLPYLQLHMLGYAPGH